MYRRRRRGCQAIEPAIFSDVQAKMAIAQEDIFGPVLSVLPYDSEDEAIAIANDTIYGLAGGVWSGDKDRALRVARRLRTGQDQGDSMLIAITGTLAGFFHVLSGPDHLAAVAPLAAADGRRGWVAGWTWGFGHAAGVVMVAVIAVLLRDALPPIDVISAWSERIVGGALIGVGLWALRRSARVDAVPHAHGTIAHEHLHVRRGPAWFRRLGHAHASFCLGVLHGIAGSSHFFGVLPALALPTRAAALTYIGAFGVGTVAAMTIFAAAVGLLGGRIYQSPTAHRAMMATAALLAIVVGGVWLL